MPRWSNSGSRLIAACFAGSLLAAHAAAAPPSGALPAEHIATIERFIKAIDEQRAADAVAMLDAQLAPDAAAKRDWLRQFSAIRSIRITAIAPSALSAPAPCSDYKVTLEVRVSVDAQAALPSYGWGDDPNDRWIRLCPDRAGAWTIASFATGP